VWDIVMRAGTAHGLRPFGMFALNSLRIEKGYRAWKSDLSTDYTVLQGGLDRFVAWTKPEFRGKAALEAEKQRGVTKRFVTLTAQVGDCDPPYMSTLWHRGEVVGETTSAYWGHRTGACVALGMLRADLAQAGTALEIEVFGTRYPAVVQGDGPIWDPKNERIRA
jgi:dimethylglycine dehydrogenase